MAEACLEPMFSLFFMKTVNVIYFRKKAPSSIFDWVLNAHLRVVLQNSCYQKNFTKSLKGTCEVISFPCESKVACWRTAFLLILSLFKDIFQGFCCCQEFFTILWRLRNTFLAEHLLIRAFVCKHSWLI